MPRQASHKKITKSSKFQVYTPRETGDERRRTLLRRIGGFKENAVIIAITTFLSLATTYIHSYGGIQGGPDKEKEEKTKGVLIVLAAMIFTYLISSGLYMLFFEVGNFGVPKERNFLRFKRVYNYMLAFVHMLIILGINIGSIVGSKLDARAAAGLLAVIPMCLAL